MKAKKKQIKKVKKPAKKPKKILVVKKRVSKKIIKKLVLKKKIKVLKKPKPKKVLIKKRPQIKKTVKKNQGKASFAKPPSRKASDGQRATAGQRKSKPSFLADSFFKAKIKVIGIGGGGGSIVSEIGRSLNKATFVVADTDARAFKKRAGIKNFLFGQELTHGLGTGVNPELGRQAAESEKEKIARFFEDQDIVIFIASLGGGLGSGATKVFAEAAQDFRGITLGIFTLPFKFEGSNKYKIAIKALRELRKTLNVSITIPNERIFKIIEANTAITDAFSIVNKSLIESLESLIDLIYSPGIINIDFADLRAILGGKGNLAFLNTSEASGKHRAEEVAEAILNNPLYQYNNFTAEKILFNIEGGENLGMFEVDKISKAISEKHQKAKIIFGISKNTKYKNKIKTTLLMTSPSVEAEVKPSVVKVPAVVPVLSKPKKLAVSKKARGIAKKRKALSKIIKAKPKKSNKPKLAPKSIPVPVFSDIPFTNQPVASSYSNMASEAKPFSRLNIVQVPVKPSSSMITNKESESLKARKAIRRTALDIKKAEEMKENEQSLQEKEWEIPAFLRLKK